MEQQNKMDILDTKLLIKYNPKVFKKLSYEKRLHNIKSFVELVKDKPLEFQKKERMLLLYEFDDGGRLYIIYPGKESARKTSGNPYDFRPLYRFPDGSYLSDLSFGDIWDDILQFSGKGEEVIAEFGALLFRLAYMYDSCLVDETLTYIDIEENDKDKVTSKGTIRLKWYKPFIDKALMNYLSKEIGQIRGMPLEAYLLFNDLLVQNEDCKYWFKKTRGGKEKWPGKPIGRINTMLTHLSIIEYLNKEVSFSEIMNRFSRGKGVAPLPLNRLESVTKGLIKK